MDERILLLFCRLIIGDAYSSCCCCCCCGSWSHVMIREPLIPAPFNLHLVTPHWRAWAWLTVPVVFTESFCESWFFKLLKLTNN